jgi:cytochrome c6
MSSSLLATIHVIAVNIFLVIYLIKTVLLFTSQSKLDAFTKRFKVIDMLVSTLFLITGIWLYAILGSIKTFQIVKLACVLVAIPIGIIGFKKHKKVLAFISLLLVVTAYGLAEMSKSKPYIANTVEVADAGLAVYQSNCAMCHGEDGKKNYRGAVDLSSSMMDATAAEIMITEGRKKGQYGTMPAFKKSLSSEQITAVASYIQGLKK